MADKKAKKTEEAEQVKATPEVEETKVEATDEQKHEVKTTKAGKRSEKAAKEAEVKAEKAERKAKGDTTPQGDAEAVVKQKVTPTRSRLERRGKNYRKVTELIEKGKTYSLKEATDLATKTSVGKFDATVELHINLNVDPKLADQNLRGTVSLPNGTGKTVRVAAFVGADQAEMSAEATMACKRAIELNPCDAFAQWISGRLSYRLNKYEEAIERFQKTIELVPDFYTAYSDLAQAYDNLGRQKEAQEMRRRTIQACKSYLNSDPTEARAHIFLATASAWLGDYDSAMEAGKKAEHLNPDDPVMMYNLACLYSLLNEGNRAVEWLQKSVLNGRRDFEWMKRDPALNNIRKHPGYLQLIES